MDNYNAGYFALVVQITIWIVYISMSHFNACIFAMFHCNWLCICFVLYIYTSLYTHIRGVTIKKWDYMNEIFIVQFSIIKLVVPFKIVSTRINTLNHSSLPRLEAAGKVLFCKASQPLLSRGLWSHLQMQNATPSPLTSILERARSRTERGLVSKEGGLAL